MKEICKKLQIAYSDDDAKDEGKRVDSLCEWRASASDKSLKEKFKQLSLVFGSNNLGGIFLPNAYILLCHFLQIDNLYKCIH